MPHIEVKSTLNAIIENKTKKMSAEEKINVRNICTDTMCSLILNGKLEPEYYSESECLAAIGNTFTNLALEDTIRKRYTSETQYEDTPVIAVKYSKIVKAVEEAFCVELDKDYIGLYKYPKVKCGECGTPCEFVTDLGKDKHSEYICPECHAHVRTHEGTDIPLGIPVSAETAKKRIQIHKEIDRLESEGYKKNNIYKILSKKMELSPEQTHAGMFNSEECDKAIAILKKIKGLYPAR